MSADPLAALRQARPGHPVLLFLAGPNGAGKSTFFDEYLASLGLPCVNADRVAAELRRVQPRATADGIDRRAFAEAERLRAALVEGRLSFCAETVFSDTRGAKLALLRRARTLGFAVVLVFVGLESAALSVARVAQRVARGGHDVPDAKLRARFPRTLANLAVAIPLADDAFLMDNSSFDQPYRVVAVYRGGELVGQYPPLPGWTRGLPGLGPELPR